MLKYVTKTKGNGWSLPQVCPRLSSLLSFNPSSVVVADLRLVPPLSTTTVDTMMVLLLSLSRFLNSLISVSQRYSLVCISLVSLNRVDCSLLSFLVVLMYETTSITPSFPIRYHFLSIQCPSPSPRDKIECFLTYFFIL